MKKLFVLGIILFSWSAVSGEEKSSSKKESGKREVASQIEVIYSIGERITVFHLSNYVTCYRSDVAYRGGFSCIKD